FGLRFCRFVGRDPAETSANFCFKSRVQMPDANTRRVSEIFRAYQRFAAKTWKHQAHQRGTSCFDGQARWQAGCGGEVIYSACLTICLKQFLDCVPCRRGHRSKLALTRREKK